MDTKYLLRTTVIPVDCGIVTVNGEVFRVETAAKRSVVNKDGRDTIEFFVDSCMIDHYRPYDQRIKLAFMDIGGCLFFSPNDAPAPSHSMIVLHDFTVYLNCFDDSKVLEALNVHHGRASE